MIVLHVTTTAPDVVVFRNGRSVSASISNFVRKKDPDTDVISPAHARVDAHEDKTGKLVGSTWSDPQSGAYTITGLDETVLHRVIATDPETDPNKIMRIVGKDRIMPEVKR